MHYGSARICLIICSVTFSCTITSLCYLLDFARLSPPQGALTNERDYESVVMMRMRQAAERQRLIEQMQREDEEDAARS